MSIINKIFSSKVFIGIQVVFTIVFLYFLFNFAVLPDMYMYGITGIVILLCLLNFLLQFKAKFISIRSVLSRILAIIISIVLVFISVEVNRGINFVDSFTGSNYETDAISVIVLNSSNCNQLSDLNGMVFGVNQQEDQENLTNALSTIRKELSDANTQYNDYSSWNNLADALYNQEVEAIIVNEAYRSMLEENHPDFDTETKVIYQVTIENKVENIANDGAIKDGVFNVCITGIDTYGPVSTRSRSDVNMVMTVNMNSHKILMTGIPRDYYVTLDSKGAKDKLTHSGIYGVNETVNTISNLLDTKMDYYFRINFSSLINVVDVLGGIDVYSDKTFIPHTNPSIQINEGANHMDGTMALAFSRERYAYESGDRHRIQNQQDVMMAIINKLLTPSVLSNYQEILEKVDGTFETNMSSDDIISLIKMQLSNLHSYEMENQYLDGTGKLMTGGYAMPKSRLYYMIPNQDTVNTAIEKIRTIENEK
ncbi:LCP family protein [Thomasclavelia sp.]|uniref:LCP family protein n=1 Tax=Thomasclavelia sp. TaxID=3025757 RepID=UPI0025D60C10|nr:LCP family protein [Thomasclavelia sp.]